MQRIEKELEATVRRPAEAEKYRMEKIAEAKRNKVILEAEADAEAIRVMLDAAIVLLSLNLTCTWMQYSTIKFSYSQRG